MKLHDLSPTPGSKRPRKRVGRGDGSGQGGTAGRGEKGQSSRSGSQYRPYFEGGQIPLFRRLPKRGFKSPDHKFYAVLNLDALEANFEANAVVDFAIVREKGLVGKVNAELKVLARGEITKPLTIKATKFSAAAKSKIEAVGGVCEIV
jgi:large subunit ribosomal protein L15